MILKRFSSIYLLICTANALRNEESSLTEVCGKRKGATGKVFGGNQVKKGEWPWLVAFTQRYEKEFFCGGNLISQKHVLSGKMSLLFKSSGGQ